MQTIFNFVKSQLIFVMFHFAPDLTTRETYRTSLARIGIALDWMLSQFGSEKNRSKPIIVNMSLGLRPEYLSKEVYRKWEQKGIELPLFTQFHPRTCFNLW